MSHGLSILARCKPERPTKSRLKKVPPQLRSVVRSMVRDAFIEGAVNQKILTGVGTNKSFNIQFNESGAKRELSLRK